MAGGRDALELLKKSSGAISGEEMATELGISRAAVWKQIERLRGIGYGVEGSPRVGYRLLGVPDEPVAEEVRPLLGPGYPGEIYYFASLDSTNSKAKELAAGGAPPGTVVLAGTQQAGRGRRGRTWESPAGGLWMSVVLRPDLPIARSSRMAIGAAVVVTEAIETVAGARPLIKWPNDLLLRGRKVAGLLIELVAELETIDQAVVGVGVNANVPLSSFSEDVGRSATSVLAEEGENVALAPLAAAIAEGLVVMGGSLADERMSRWSNAWRSRSAVLGRPVVIETDGALLEGEAVDIDADGALLVRGSSGELVTARLGEASLRIGQ